MASRIFSQGFKFFEKKNLRKKNNKKEYLFKGHDQLLLIK